jgi:hypothetical protein
MRLRPRQWLSVVCSTLLIAGCGDDDSGNPGSPSPNPGGNSGQTCASVGPLGAAKGTLTATVDGAAFNGGVSTGNSLYTPIPPGPFLPTPHDFITIAAVCGDGSQIVLGLRAGSFVTPPGGGTPQFVLGAAGTTQIGVNASGVPFTDPQTQQPLNHIVQYIRVVNGAASGGWFVSLAGGSGSITFNNVSPQAASGSFALTMAATPSTGSTGTRTVTGTFNVTF